MSDNSRLRAIWVINQWESILYKQRIPKSSCVRKETADIGVLVISRNGDGKIMQSIRITSRPPLRIWKCNHLNQFR